MYLDAAQVDSSYGNVSIGVDDIGGSESDIPFYAGFIAAAVAIVFYGTNFAPVKKFDTGDGMFFQWILCIAIWCTGLAVNVMRGQPKFYPIVMLGGLIWETGNICVVPIIKTLGLGLGLCVWGMTNLLSGWATGRFGFFGVDKDVPDKPALNYIGVALAVVSAVIFSMIKNDVGVEVIDQVITVDSTEQTPLLSQASINQRDAQDEAPEDHSFLDNLSPSMKRIVGLTLSVFSGVMYGQLFTPAIYVQDNYEDSSQNGLDYVFATFSGILASSTVYFLIYAAYQHNQPKVYPRAILPGFISGIMWGIATSSWFIANKVLSEAVAFPIVTTGPAVVASLLGVFIFKEIQGRRNILILLAGMSITITGSILCGLSKKAKS